MVSVKFCDQIKVMLVDENDIPSSCFMKSTTVIILNIAEKAENSCMPFNIYLATNGNCVNNVM